MAIDPALLLSLVEEAVQETLKGGPSSSSRAPQGDGESSGIARWLRDLQFPEPLRHPPPYRRPGRPSAQPPSLPRPTGIPSPRRPQALQEMMASSPARLGVGRAGVRCRTSTVLQFLADHAVALDAVASTLSEDFAGRHRLLPVQSRVTHHQEYLLRPDLGRLLHPESEALLGKEAHSGADVQVVVGDGLSASAVELQWPRMEGPLREALEGVGLKLGTPVFARFSRVMLQDRIAEATRARASVLIIGERPGLGGGDGVSAYMVYQPRSGTTDADKNMIPNICDWGMPPQDAALAIARCVRAMFDQGLSGTLLKLD